MLTDLIYALEAQDTLPSGPALKAVFDGESELAASLLAQPGAPELLEGWAHERLEGMHQIKCLALEAALRSDPSGQNKRKMAADALGCLRQAISENPALSVDAQVLAQMSQQGMPLAFTHAARVLREQAPGVVPADTEQLSGACAVASWAIGRIYDPAV